MARSKQLNATVDDELYAQIALKAQEWNVSPSEAGKRLMSQALGNPISVPDQTTIPLSAPVELSTASANAEIAALREVIVSLTASIIAMQKSYESALAGQVKIYAEPLQVTASGNQVFTEEQLNLRPEFVADIKRNARPGKRLDA